MPGYDGAGPAGMGPMTGGGRGFCAVQVSAMGTRPSGRGFFGRDGGRGHRNRYYATGLPGWARAGYGGVGMPALSEKEEALMLKEDAISLKKELAAVEQRLAALEKAKGSKK